MRSNILSTLRGGSTSSAALLLVSLLFSAAPALAQVQVAGLSLGAPQSAEPGEIVDVTVSLGSLINVSELAVVKFAVGYDPDVLVPVDATAGAALANWPLADFAAFDGETGFVIEGFTAQPVAVSPGVLVTVRFEVRSDAVDGAVGALSIAGAQPGQPAILLDALDAPETGIKVSTNASSVSVVGGVPCTPGDANVDGTVNTADAILVLRNVIDLVQFTPQQNCNADANVDGSVNTGDAVKILRTVVGLPRTAATSAAFARLEATADGARLIVEPAFGIHGLQATVRIPGHASLASLDAPAVGLLLDAADGTSHRIAWAAGDELGDGASSLQLELPVRGSAALELVELRVFDANGTEIPLQLEGAMVPSGDRLAAVRLSNHPNPFNPSTKIQFELPRRGTARVELFNAAGQRVRVLVDGELGEGAHEVVWNGTDDQGRTVSSGVYYARLASEAGEARHRLLLVK